MKRRDFLPAALLAAIGIAAYCNSLSVPFLFDDFYHIVDNPNIRNLLNPAAILGETTRPLVNLSLALNYALGGLDVRGYHLFNLLVHLLAGITLFGVVRRALLSERLAPRWAQEAAPLALAAAALWLVHPLQTQSVTYVIQRGESLMGLFYLLTLYCAIRGWTAGAVLACALGMLSKPVMVTAPLTALLYDRTFLSSSWRELFRCRWRLHAGLAATWAILPLVLSGGAMEYRGLVGLNLKEAITPWQYLETEPGVILHYLRLSFWPHPLILDYAWPVAHGLRQAALPAAVVGLLLAATLWALRRRPAAGFLGAWFFLILAPTSSLLPIVDPAFEHRMYLPLAAVLLLTLLGARRLAGRHRRLFWALPLLLVPALAAATFRHNELYRDPVSFWEEQVRWRPGNARAYNDLGAALQQAGRGAEAEQAIRRSLALKPNQSDAHNNLAYLLLLENKREESALHYREALRLKPDSAVAHKGMGRLFQEDGRLEEAAAEYRQALRLNPVFSDARIELGLILQNQGKTGEAMRQYRKALEVDPRNAAAYNNIGTLLFLKGRWQQAQACFSRAVRLAPDYAEAYGNLGASLQNQGKLREAVACYKKALKINPQEKNARSNLEKITVSSP